VRLLAGRWTLALLGELSSGGRRYQELRDVLDGISHKVLTETLRRAERGGLIRRQLDHDRIETATLYQLTELGRSLELPLSAFGQWAALNWPTVDMAQRQWDNRSDGSSPSP
jgi:DNA-binding HxlR family transcriptional regulator